MSDGVEAQSEQTALKRSLGTPMLVLFVIGDIVGAGLYALIGEVAGTVGGAVWAPMLVAFGFAVLTAMSYAELVTKYPKAAGAALYTNRAFRRPFFTFLVAFLVLLNGVVSASVVARSFGGEYLATFLELPTVPVAIGFLLLIAAINYFGISGSAGVNAVLTILTAAGVLSIVVIGVVAIADGRGDVSHALEFEPAHGSVVLAVLAGAYIAFFSMIGFEDSVNLAEEARNPARSYPLALIGGLGVTALLYFAVAFVSTSLVEPGDLAASSGPLLHVVNATGIPFPPTVFALTALLALANTGLMNMIMASRLLYGMAGEQVIPSAFGRTNSRFHTPGLAIVVTTAVAAVLVSTTNVRLLAETAVLVVLTLFGIVNICVLVLRRSPVAHKHFRTPSVLPVLGVAASLVFASPIVQRDPGVYWRAALLLGVGVLLWFGNHLLMRRAAATG